MIRDDTPSIIHRPEKGKENRDRYGTRANCDRCITRECVIYISADSAIRYGLSTAFGDEAAAYGSGRLATVLWPRRVGQIKSLSVHPTHDWPPCIHYESYAAPHFLPAQTTWQVPAACTHVPTARVSIGFKVQTGLIRPTSCQISILWIEVRKG